MSKKIRSFKDLEFLDKDLPILTLFSGGLDSSYLLLRLKQLGFQNIHALSVQLGEMETREAKERIAQAFDVQLHCIDKQREFTNDFVSAAIKSQGMYLDTHPVSSTLSRPLIAKTAVQLAQDLNISSIIHTANRSQNTLRRLNSAFALLGFQENYGSPYDLEPISRTLKLAELELAGVGFTVDRTVSGDSNLWCREFESGVLDNPENHDIHSQIFSWSAYSTELKDQAESISITFRDGLPCAVDEIQMDLLSLICHLNPRIGKYGFGRYTGLEHLEQGEKVFEVREMPAAWFILKSLRHLEGACLSAEHLRIKQSLEQIWVREALEGRWFGKLKESTEAFIDNSAKLISGTVQWRLSLGSALTSSIVAGNSLYLTDRELWEEKSIIEECDSIKQIFRQHIVMEERVSNI